jgi:hypothetical protein
MLFLFSCDIILYHLPLQPLESNVPTHKWGKEYQETAETYASDQRTYNVKEHSTQ